MLDPVVGKGDTPERQARNRKLRQAISIAIDWEEYSNGSSRSKAGEAAMGPLPPGVFGSRDGTPGGFNPVTHTLVDGKRRAPPDRRGEGAARRGRLSRRPRREDRPAAGAELRLPRAADARERKPEIDWMVRQFAKLGVQLEVRATDYNQFQDKVRKGSHQVFWLGWLADYPDAENFLFLLYGPNGKTRVRRREHGQLRQPRVRPAVTRR